MNINLTACVIGIVASLLTESILAQQVTFSRDIAPIFQEKCESCHRVGAMAPMPLVTFDDVRPWARAIKRVITAGEMPPWQIDKSAGVRNFKNDRSLKSDQIDTIIKWLEDGSSRGNPDNLPPPISWPAGDTWIYEARFGPPDLILTSPEYTQKASEPDVWFRPVTETGIMESRWVRAIEIRPSTSAGHRITHHAIAKLQQDEPVDEFRTNFPDDIGPGLFMEWAIGKQGEMMRPDTGKLMRPGSQIWWDIHHHAAGEEITTSVEMAIYFYPRNKVPKYRQVLGNFNAISGDPRTLDIPPFSKTMHQGTHVMKQAGRVENFQPHMHLRGQAMTMEALLPDGTERMLSRVNNFQFNWHNNYIYSDNAAPLLPRGTILRFSAWHDNTIANRNNPDPSQWVGWGDRTIDEMAHAWVNITYMSDEDYFSELKKRREKQPSPQ